MKIKILQENIIIPNIQILDTNEFIITSLAPITYEKLEDSLKKIHDTLYSAKSSSVLFVYPSQEIADTTFLNIVKSQLNLHESDSRVDFKDLSINIRAITCYFIGIENLESYNTRQYCRIFFFKNHK